MRRLSSPGCALLLGLLLALLTIGTPAVQATSPGVLITEIQAANTRTVADDQGGYPDWIELHNPTDTPVSLLGYTLTDDPAAPTKWPLPVTTLAPGAFLVIWASGLDQVTPEGWHTSFRLSRAGEYVGLFGPHGQVVDEVTFWEQEVDVSLGRLGTVSNQWVPFPTPTPGAANTTRHRLRAPPDAPSAEVTPDSGRYAGSVTVRLYTPVPGSLLYYTLDGADPTVDGHEYTAPLEVTETTVLRAVALNEGVPVSAVTTATYLVGESTGLPVLSLVTDPAHLWDEATGIYTNTQERGRRWERPVTVVWLPPEGGAGFSVGAGLRIHGNWSRAYSTKQSFRLYFRGEYGSTGLAYPLFGAAPGQTYDRLVLRGGFNDTWLRDGAEAVYVRDQLVRELHGAMDQVAARGRWVALYLNGAYWGLYNLTERIDDTFLATHFGASEWYINSASGEQAPGSTHRWNRFVDWLTRTDLRVTAQYEQAIRQLDIENFTDYILLNLWARNTDWPHVNWIAARPRAGLDTRWRFFVWDAETTFEREENAFARIVTASGFFAQGRLGQILASLLQNAQYRAYFTAQIKHQSAGVLDTASVRARLDTLAAEVRPAIAAEAARWQPEQEPAVLVAQWETALQRISDSLDFSAQQLHQLSDPETVRQLLPPRAASAAPSPVAPADPPGVRITEVQAANTHTALDDQGRYSDWIELHNPTDTPITLVGYTLTDDPTRPAKWPVPIATLAPGAFLVIWASGEDLATRDSWYSSFRLSRAGGYVGLFGPDGQLVDEVTFGPQLADVSLGRLPGSEQWVAFLNPTPGAANTTPPRAPPDTPPVVVMPDSGRFAGPVTVQLATPMPGSTVHFTLDGADPTVDGQAYTAPVRLAQTAVLRAVALRDGVPVSTVTTATYLLGVGAGLPVLSLVSDPAHPWDEATGISTNAQQHGRRGERSVTMEWLSPEGAASFSVGAGLRIHRNTGRDTAKQSFRLYFRGEYGPRELVYPLFGKEPGQTYARLVLRAEDQDSWQCDDAPQCVAEAVYVRGQLMRELHRAMGQLAARGRWVAVYLNGAHWGLYHLTEHLDETFLATHFDASAWYTSAPAGEQAPDNAHRWQLVADWLASADLSTAGQYEQAIRQLDIENFTSFIILRLWNGDTAWGSQDWYAARMRSGPDTRWRLFLRDAAVLPGEYGLTSGLAVSGSGANGALIPILASLLASPQYQAYFTAQVEQHLAGALATESVRSRLATLAAELRPAMAAEAARWWPEQEPDVAVAQWEAALQRFSDSLDTNAQRLRDLSDPATLRQHLPQLAATAAVPAPQSLPPNTRIALLVHHAADLTPGDAAVVAHLEARDATVTILGTDDGSTHDPAQVAASQELLLLSSSIRLLDMAARYAQTATPLIFWEPRLLEATRVPLSSWGGTRSQQTDILIVDADHPITAGLSVDQRLRAVRRPDTFSVAYPPSGPGVQVLATHLFGRDPALLAAEAGAELSNGQPARARTVFLYWHHDTFHQSTGEAIRLFDQAVDWALGLPADDSA